MEKKKGPKDFNAVARYYRIAAAYGHYKANHNLQVLVSEGLADSPNRHGETIALAQQLIKDGVPGGYYDMAYYLELGYGVKQDQELALRYYRKAADLGSPEAQFFVAKQLAPADIAPSIARQMRECAAAQGHGEAANALGINLQDHSFYAEAVQAFQQGVATGDAQSAYFLSQAFLPARDGDRPPAEQLYFVNLATDNERSRRYGIISDFLAANDGRNPKVPDIDQIVPLPPAPLPPWDGTFQWQKEQEQIPSQPSDELIERMSKSKHLDPATGLPLPPPPKTALGTKVKTGLRCPESGQWCIRIEEGLVLHKRRFRKGDVLPTYRRYQPRWLSLLDDIFGMRYQDIEVVWELVRHADHVS
ncbi:sel1 repeat family protein [Dyella monticola]|uniref:Sel1 repeat family protein n=1 Tax=Dyella monticola TaxID=1927958 RepID=A0A370WS07_9GAMM|nr:sel1 repeat family protein [Dyella monticola]